MEKVTDFRITWDGVYEFVKLQLEDEGISDEKVIDELTDRFIEYLELDVYDWFKSNWRIFEADMDINEIVAK